MTLPDVTKVSEIMRKVAETEIRPRFKNLKKNEIGHKEGGGIVTIADIESERILAKELTNLIPGSLFVGEEVVEENPEVYDFLTGEEPIWIVDPIDGTSNFKNGCPDYVVLVAFAIHGIVRFGAILQPETQELLVAEEGSGTWTNNNRLVFENSYEKKTQELKGSLGRALREKCGIKKCFSSIGRAGSCGIEYKRIAQGELDFSFYRSLKPWDHAAGDLIIREAGGKVAYLNNTLYLFKRSGFSGLLCAPSENCWQQVAKIISKFLN